MKIKEEQLKKINEQQEAISAILSKIGYLEAQKHGYLHEMVGINQEVDMFKKELEEEYGSINIDLNTGEYTEVKESETTEPQLEVVSDVK